MKYIIVCKDNTAFYTNWYDYENNWNADTIYCVLDVYCDKVTFDGKKWGEIDEDHL